MKIQTPPGMRDFYPDLMRTQNWLFDAWRRASLAFGFSEYEGPIFESLDLYRIKSGDGIVSELFSFEDRGGRAFAIRPEMTPTLARMVAARANALPRPIKWFSIPRMCRAEKPQRGRLREFFQWNVDVLGVDDPLADAEVIATVVAFARDIGLSAEDVAVRLSSRPLVSAMLQSVGIGPDQNEQAFALIDRHDRLAPEEFAKAWDAAYGKQVSCATLTGLLNDATLDDCLKMADESGEDGQASSDQFRALWQRLADFRVDEFCVFDLRTVRGLAYYTGSVFEMHARKGSLRALMGGGRYDNLTGLLDGPAVPGVGFGMGDAPMLELLKELDRLPELSDDVDVYVIDADKKLFQTALEIVAGLRAGGLRVDFSYKRQGVGKQFKSAATRGAGFAIVVGDEYAERGQLTVKNLKQGTQSEVAAEALLASPAETLREL